MGAFAINETSEMSIDSEHLTIRIAHRACAPWIWSLITRLAQIASEQPNDDTTTGVGIAHVSLSRPWRYRALDWFSHRMYSSASSIC